jgi:hypothetical protein
MRQAWPQVTSRSIQNFRNWLNKSEPTEWIGQIVALTGALLGITTWLYKELIIPNTAPVNIDLSTEVKSLTNADNNSNDAGSRLDSAVINVTVKNPSTRKITLYGPRWILLGRRRHAGADIKGAPDTGSQSFIVDRRIARDFNAKQRKIIEYSERFSVILFTQNPDSLHEPERTAATKDKQRQGDALPTRWEMISIGPLFSDTEMEGKATVSSQKAVFFAGSRYDMVESKILIPTTPSDSKTVQISNLGYETIFCNYDRPAFCNRESALNELAGSQKTHALFLYQQWCLRPPYYSRFGPSLSPHDLISLYSLERLSPKKPTDTRQARSSKYCPTDKSTGDRKTIQEEINKMTSDEIRLSNDFQVSGGQVFSTSLQIPTQKMTSSVK